jgi:iron complex transport system substrate-binding protein
MKRSLQFLVVLVLFSSLLAACAAPTPAAAPSLTEPPATEAPAAVSTPAPTEPPEMEKITVVDALGREVVFDQPPSRIMIVGKAAFMLLDAAFLFPEAPEKIIGYELRSQTGLDFIHTAFPQSGNMIVLEMDAGPEQIAPANPDLVLMKSYLKEQLGDQVELLGIKVVYLDLETPEAINQDIRTLGKLFGNTERAEQLVTLYDQARAKITDITSVIPEEEKPSTLLLQYSDKGGEVAFSVPTGGFLQTQLVEMAGGAPVWKGVTGKGWSVITLEQIAAWNPEIIIVVDYRGKAMEAVDRLKADENWQQLDAVKNKKLYAFPLDFQSWDQPDSRWTLGLTWLATILQPERFASLKMREEIPAFYTDFYGLSESVIEQSILPLVKGDFLE